MKRRDAREAAFLLIFEKEFRSEPIEELIETAVECRGLELDDYARCLVEMADRQVDELDQKIAANLTNWKINRLPKATLAILRLALCELDCFADIPIRVTINEAIELAKRYATDEDGAYINGVLGSYVKTASLEKNDDGLGDKGKCKEQ